MQRAPSGGWTRVPLRFHRLRIGVSRLNRAPFDSGRRPSGKVTASRVQLPAPRVHDRVPKAL